MYEKQVRCILEYAVPVWHPALTGKDRLRIERVQKSALNIILGDKYKSYRSALKLCKMETLFMRRQSLCGKFAKKSKETPKFSTWFKPNQKKTNSRSTKTQFCNVRARTERYKRSPISFMTELLNK